MENQQAYVGEVWDQVWEHSGDANVAGILREEVTPRWKGIERAVRWRFGTFMNLRVVEIGSGHGTNALQFARRGAQVTLVDLSEKALEGAKQAADVLRVHIDTVVADLFEPDPRLDGRFDVSCSFGLAEHFLDAERVAVIAAHLRCLQPAGITAIGVPNRWGVAYRAWMAVLKKRKHWPFGIEEPFTRTELESLVRQAGGDVLASSYGSFPASIINYLVNPVLHHSGRPGITGPQFRSPFDRLAYELLVVAQHAR